MSVFVRHENAIRGLFHQQAEVDLTFSQRRLRPFLLDCVCPVQMPQGKEEQYSGYNEEEDTLQTAEYNNGLAIDGQRFHQLVGRNDPDA